MKRHSLIMMICLVALVACSTARAVDKEHRCAACKVVVDAFVTRLEKEAPRNHIDLRHRVGQDGKRYGKVIDYRVSELRAAELLDDLCEDTLQWEWLLPFDIPGMEDFQLPPNVDTPDSTTATAAADDYVDSTPEQVGEAAGTDAAATESTDGASDASSSEENSTPPEADAYAGASHDPASGASDGQEAAPQAAGESDGDGGRAAADGAAGDAEDGGAIDNMSTMSDAAIRAAAGSYETVKSRGWGWYRATSDEAMNPTTSRVAEAEGKTRKRELKAFCYRLLEDTEEALTAYLTSTAERHDGLEDMLCRKLSKHCPAEDGAAADAAGDQHTEL